MSVSLSQLVGYVPAFVQRWLAQAPQPPVEPPAESQYGAVLLADITGFTPLATQLAQLGPEGAEQLDAILNAFYSRLVDMIVEHGGDVACYAGDAAIALWPSLEPQPAEAVRRAAQLGLELQQRLNGFPAAPGVTLTMRICIGAGAVSIGGVGGVSGHWRPLLIGEPLDQIGRATASLRVGEVVLTAEARDAGEGSLFGETLPDGRLLLRRVESPLLPEPLAPPRLPESALAALRCFVPQTVLARLDAGQATWLSDLRQLSVVFVKLGGLDVRDADALARLHRVMQTLQRLMLLYEGEVVQLLQDDKGLVAVLAFGLPPLIHEDDAARAVAAGLKLQEQLRPLGLSADIGVASGRLFSGPRGSDRRREYSITGLVANLAARLMSKSESEVLCDEMTASASRGRTTLSELPPLLLKGIRGSVSAFHAVGVGTRLAAQKTSMLVGRSRERKLLEALLDFQSPAVQSPAVQSPVVQSPVDTQPDIAPPAIQQFDNQQTDDQQTDDQQTDDQQLHRKRIAWIEGEAGVGKSALLGELRRLAAARGAAICTGECEAIERATPYFLWRSVVGSLFHVEPTADAAEARQRVLARLAFNPALPPLASLLNSVLPLDFLETESIAQLDGRARADNLQDLLVSVCNEAAGRQPLVIVLDDVQWIDSASRRLALVVAQRCEEVVLALAARPLDELGAAEFEPLFERPDAQRVTLDALPRDELIQLACRLLDAERLAPPLAAFLYERSGGNPFYADELIRYLQEEGLLERRGGFCDLSSSATGAANVPSSIRALITHRIDRLPLPEQLTLRTATVVGRTFPQRTVVDVYQDEQHRPDVDDHLRDCTRRKLIQVETPDPDPAFAFKHVTIQQVTYDQIPLANRRRLHREIGRWYERHHGESANCYSILAYHFGRGEEFEREIEYLAKAGEHALRNYANREAAQAFQTALDRHAEHRRDAANDPARRRLGHWRRQLGEALFQLGRLPEAQLELEAALQLLGRPPPLTAWGVRLSIVRQLSRQSLHRLLPWLLTRSANVDSGEESAGGLHETAMVLQRLSQVHYLKVEILEGLDRALCGLNVAERAGRSPLLARAYSGLGLVAGMLRSRRIAGMYGRLSESTARQTGHKPTLAYVLMATGVYRLGVGRWEQVRRDALESIGIAEQIADQHQVALSLTLEAMRGCFVGEHRVAARHYERIQEIGRNAGNDLHEAWGYSGGGECLFRLGKLAEAAECFHNAIELLADKEHATEEIRLSGLLAAVYLRQGNMARAEQFARQAVRLIDAASYTTVSTLEGFSGAVEVLLARWRESPGDATCRREAEQACAQLAWYAKVFPIGWPRWYEHDGTRQWLLGHRQRALRSWRRSLREALRWEMPLETATAHYRLGLAEERDSPRRAEHLRDALRIFEELGAAHEIGLVARAQESSG